MLPTSPSSYIHHSYCIWKTFFPFSHLSSRDLIIFLTPIVHGFFNSDIRALIKTLHLGRSDSKSLTICTIWVFWLITICFKWKFPLLLLNKELIYMYNRMSLVVTSFLYPSDEQQNLVFPQVLGLSRLRFFYQVISGGHVFNLMKLVLNPIIE